MFFLEFCWCREQWFCCHYYGCMKGIPPSHFFASLTRRLSVIQVLAMFETIPDAFEKILKQGSEFETYQRSARNLLFPHRYRREYWNSKYAQLIWSRNIEHCRAQALKLELKITIAYDQKRCNPYSSLHSLTHWNGHLVK